MVMNNLKYFDFKYFLEDKKLKIYEIKTIIIIFF